MPNILTNCALLGNEEYTLVTHSQEFAYTLFERALDIGIEAHVTPANGDYVIELSCTESDYDTALTLAYAGEVLV